MSGGERRVVLLAATCSEACTVLTGQARVQREQPLSASEADCRVVAWKFRGETNFWQASGKDIHGMSRMLWCTLGFTPLSQDVIAADRHHFISCHLQLPRMPPVPSPPADWDAREAFGKDCLGNYINDPARAKVPPKQRQVQAPRREWHSCVPAWLLKCLHRERLLLLLACAPTTFARWLAAGGPPTGPPRTWPLDGPPDTAKHSLKRELFKI
mmetsp:Transcript_51430/g.85302  ORF Transcript_51430/g.85302 Transcript_51430/m.85302 type:complete len:213 (+) Transcript_51430:3-641(+)